MQSRIEIQQKASEKILLNNFKGIINVAPRVGKSKIVCDALKTLKSTKKILITVPYNSIIESWQYEFEKWKVKSKNITLINQRSLSKVNLTSYNVIICDEIHTLSQSQIDLLKETTCPILGVSGSISKETEKQLRQELDLNIIFKYSIEEAINAGIIANYEVYLVPVTLNSTNKYIKAGSKDKEFFTSEYHNYQYLTSEFERFKKMSWGNKKFETVKMTYASKRASLIYESRTKIEAVKKIIQENERCLIFTARTEVANELADSYHSKSPIDTLDKFMSNEISKLAVCEMTNMGITFPNLKIGIFHQMKSSEESAIQKVMRMCNMEDDEIAKIYITYYANTVDEEWTKKALIGLDPDKIKILIL